MSDIHDCRGCGDKVYIDNAESCVACGDWFCGACSYENGEYLWDEKNHNSYYICKSCLDQGLDYINENNEDYAVFSEEEYDRVIKELNKRQLL